MKKHRATRYFYWMLELRRHIAALDNPLLDNARGRARKSRDFQRYRQEVRSGITKNRRRVYPRGRAWKRIARQELDILDAKSLDLWRQRGKRWMLRQEGVMTIYQISASGIIRERVEHDAKAKAPQ